MSGDQDSAGAWRQEAAGVTCGKVQVARREAFSESPELLASGAFYTLRYVKRPVSAV